MTGAVLLALGLVLAFGVDQLVARHRSERPVRWAVLQFAGWLLVGFVVAGVVAVVAGVAPGTEFTTVLILEKTLSVDNVAVFAVIMGVFAVAAGEREKQVGRGIGVALVLRTGMVLAGLALVDRVHALLPAMGVLLLVLGGRMLFPGRDQESSRGVPRALRRLGPAGPLLAIGLADLVFAVDSVPAALAVTRDPYVVVGATGLAMLGLRPSYLLLDHGLQRLKYLPMGVAAVLVALGIELIVGIWVHVPDLVTMLVAVGIVGGSCVVSLESVARRLRRVGKIAAGFTLVLIGIALLVLPGPGLLVLGAGLVMLSTESPWLQRHLGNAFERLPRSVRNRTPQRLIDILLPPEAKARQACMLDV